MWPPNYSRLFEWRQKELLAMGMSREYAGAAFEFYRRNPVSFIARWVDTYDPRNAGQDGKLVRPPLVLFPKQVEYVNFLTWCLENETNGLVEKSRDMGATWVTCAFSVWAFLFLDGCSVGWGSRKEMLVDRFGDLDSIFEKIRMILRYLPPFFMPRDFNWAKHSNYMRLVNPENGSSITGEAGDNIGRGGRKRIYFKDESAHYEHPEAVEAALADNTRVQIDMSSVNGIGNVFHRRREAGVEWQPDSTDFPNGKTAVFIMDWRDHPEKSDEWYLTRRKRAEDDGLLHVFYQEVDRNYASSVEGVVIPPEWVVAALDAHIKLGFEDDGGWVAALDVADAGGDRNAYAARKGVILKEIDLWGARDTGETTNRAINLSQFRRPLDLQYDSIGVGAGVKAEANRIADSEDPRIEGIRFIDWNASSSPLFPDRNVISGDRRSPLNKDFYANLKAQGWWMLRRRFEATFNAVEKGRPWGPDEVISIDTSDIPKDKLGLLRKELSQPTMSRTVAKSKLIIDKQPEGVRSPNIADAVMMCYWPSRRISYDETLSWVA